MPKNRQQPPDEVIVNALRAINGEITRNMRMVVFAYDGESARFRFYMDQEPNEDEREHAECAAVNFDSLHPGKLENIELEFVITDKPLGLVDHLDFTIFRRSESL